MIPPRYFEPHIGKVINLGSEIDCLNGLFGRLESVDQAGFIVIRTHVGDEVIVELESVARFIVGPKPDELFRKRAAGEDDDDDDEHPLARMMRAAEQRAARGITVPPDTQAALDAMLADDEP